MWYSFREVMRRLTYILAAAFGLLVFAPAGEAQDSRTRRAERNATRESQREARNQANAIAKCDFTREFAALDDAADLLADVHDEKSAQKAAKKICALFNPLPPPMGGTEEQLEQWARKQNRLNYQMERLRQEKWFVSSGLQEAWTLATDPFSRRRASKK